MTLTKKKPEFEEFQIPQIGGLSLRDAEGAYQDIGKIQIPIDQQHVVDNYHFMINLLSGKAPANDDPKKYSVIQLRFFDYIYTNYAKNARYNIEPDPTFGKDDEKAEKEKKEKEEAAAAKAADVPKDFSTVFNYQQSKPAQINTAYSYYIPNPKIQQKDMETLSEAPSDKTQQKKTDVYSKYMKQNKSHQKLPVSTEVSKNYDYLFESSISKTGQYNSVDKSPIVISENQLICGKPQNDEVEIEVQNNGNNTRLVRKHFGAIDFSNPIENINLYEIEDLVDIEERYVNINCQLAKEYRVNLNQPAIVTLENVFPNSNDDKYDISLRKYCLQNDLTFIHYFSNKGTLIFYVKNFENGPFHFPIKGEKHKNTVIKLTEIMNASITRQNVIQDFLIEGNLAVETVDAGKYAIKLHLPENSDDFEAYSLNQEDQRLLPENNVLLFENDGSENLFTQNLLQWNYKLKDANELPLSFSFNINDGRNDNNLQITTFECNVSVDEYLTFKNVVILINVPNANEVVVSHCYGENEISVKESRIRWTITDIDKDIISKIKFSLPQCKENEFFPIYVQFQSDTMYCDVNVDSIAKVDESGNYDFNEKTEYDIDRSFSSERFLIQ